MSADTDAPQPPWTLQDPLFLFLFLLFLLSRGRAAGLFFLAAVRSQAALLGCLLLLCSAEARAPASKNVTVTAGQNVTLECRAQVSKDDVIAVFQWKKPELKSERYVFFFKDDHFNGIYQDERFLDRVQLRDQQMKNGDVSVVLRNVTADDSGTYECRVIVEHNGRSRVRRHEPEPVSIVQLTVTEPGTTGGGGNMHGHTGLIAAVAVFSVIVTGLILVSIRQRKNSDHPADGDDAERETLTGEPRSGSEPRCSRTEVL